MLTMTEDARSAIRALADQQATPETSGIRIYSRDAAMAQLTLAVASAPEAGDETVEADGARVFLDATAQAELDGCVLDASVGDGRVSFHILNRESEA